VTAKGRLCRGFVNIRIRVFHPFYSGNFSRPELSYFQWQTTAPPPECLHESGTKAAQERLLNDDKVVSLRFVSGTIIIITGTFADQLAAGLDVPEQEWSNYYFLRRFRGL
jgi:hypothetical protein